MPLVEVGALQSTFMANFGRGTARIEAKVAAVAQEGQENVMAQKADIVPSPHPKNALFLVRSRDGTLKAIAI